MKACKRVGHANTEKLLVFTFYCQMIPDLLEKIQDNIGFFYKVAAFFRESDSLTAAFYDLHIPLCLNGFQPFGQGGLCHIKGICGLGDAALFCQDSQDLPINIFHMVICLSGRNSPLCRR